MFWEQKIEYAVLSDIGFRRKNNQDAYVVQIASDREHWDSGGHLFMVADGMGGHAVGELASKIAVNTVPHTFHKMNGKEIEERLKGALEAANAAINERGEQNHEFSRMGTTCSTLLLSSRGAHIGHVGDSRVYRIRGDRIEQLTFDHSLQWELLKQGTMSAEEIYLREPRNVITRSLGPEPSVQVDIEGPYQVRGRDIYVLCSDGLSTMVSDEEVGIITRELPPKLACQLLVNLANLRGGSDNITVAVVRVGEAPPELKTQSAEMDTPPAESGTGWGWLAAFATLGLGLVSGFALTVLGTMRSEMLAPGIAVETISILGFGALCLFWMRTRRQQKHAPTLAEIPPGTPYRTSSAQLTKEFIGNITNLETSLQRTAQEENWKVDWELHAKSYQSARNALATQKPSAALPAYARAIHVLVEGMLLQRKQRDLATRWGLKVGDDPESN